MAETVDQGGGAPAPVSAGARRGRRRVTVVVLAIGIIATAASLLAGYVHDTLSDSDEFASRAEDAYSTPVVREQLADVVVDQLIEAEPDLVAVQPLLESIVDGALRSEVATGLVRAAVADLHRTVFDDADDTVTMQIADLILVAKTQLTALDPEAGALIPDELTDAIVELDTDDVFVDAVQAVDGLGVVALLLPMFAAMAFAGVVWLSPSGSGALVRIGGGLVGAAALALVIEGVVRALVVPGDDAVAGAVWDAFAGEFPTWAFALAGIGAVVAVVAWFGVGETDVAAAVRRVGPVVGRREDRHERILWSIAAVVLGAVVILDWQLVVRFGITAVGAALVATGIRELAAVVAPSLVEGAAAQQSEIDAAQAAPAPRSDLASDPRRWSLSVGLLILGLVAVIAMDRGRDGQAEEVGEACNGADEFCDMRVDEIVVAATHNGHAAADEGFTLGYQRVGIAAQLEAGVRGLLIDVYFGRAVDDDVVITDRAALTAAERDQLVDEIGESAVLSAEATAARADASGVERALFLCHALCEIGASRFEVELGAIARFIKDNPREVVLIVIQDEGPRPADVAAAFESAGLGSEVYAHQIGEPWPTLAELIDAETRVIVFAENIAGEFDWYHDAFAHIQDTPFGFKTVEEFSCDLNRGEADHSLFLVNHWLSPVSLSAADIANDPAVIDDRFQACSEQRGQLPNMIAVDFFSQGDVVDTVLALNGG